ncbi:pullulanase-type alpha-1,6-glucosidase [Aquimonas sp.]|jgi:pullulanase-type alpha-1,6-glucosidase|uniref:pullulanase-type alpha-1,6-glucosidase n=1 Tax=Aquimonas sp. TaxID=1872588 RepID=UPI0037BEA1B8
MHRSIVAVTAALALITATGLHAQSTQPDRITLVGSLQQAIGCSENWAPPCEASALAFDEEDGVWQQRFPLAAGNYEYKVALNGSWDLNFGAGGAPGGANIALTLNDPAAVKFYFRSGRNAVADDRNQLIPVAVGNFQQAIGCSSNWDPSCLRGWLEDPEDDGSYSHRIALPAGSFEAKVAMNESWDINYGAGGTQGGANIPFEVAGACTLTEFRFDGLSNALSIAPASAPPQPDSVTIAGSLQQALGCADNWSPACVDTQLIYSAQNDLWRGEFNLPAGSYEYKAALNGSWDENYGLNAERGGANIPLNLSSSGAVRFYFSPASKWVTDSRSATIAVAAGSFQSELGCAADWQPACLASWLQDPDGDGIYTLDARLPAGSYEAKVAINEGWDENYGAGGAAGGANIAFEVPEGCGLTYFSFVNASKLLTISSSAVAPRGSLAEARAHFIDARTLAWSGGNDSARFALHADAEAGLRLGSEGVEGGRSIELTVVSGGLSAAQRARFPHLAGYRALRLPELPRAELAELLRGQLALAARSASDQPLDATAVQIPGVLDALYTTERPLGPVLNSTGVTLNLWAPTAKSVHLLLFNDSDPTATPTRHSMQFDAVSGVWSVSGARAWNRRFYLYEVEVYAPSTRRIETNRVTDPYSLSLAADSTLSQIVDLSEAALMPPLFRLTPKPVLTAHEDSLIYELHVRDFSIGDSGVPASERGTFAAFARPQSDGMRHLRRLAKAGFTHVHLLPAFDQANIAERRSAQQSVPFATLDALPPDSTDQQALTSAIRDADGFNWGYDPWHYTVPEGSYATDPDGPTRIREFRQMVQTLNLSGLRVVMDVVYNHTNAAGQNAKSVLDRVVPGYYHRLNNAGYVEQSSCCPNTASEHAMMERLLIDSVLVWAKAYRVDGFRFDLMGHHSRDNLLKLRAALDALTLARDGIDGRSIVLYGEGWNFGEVANNARFVQATQANLAGTGIGTFSDRSRDAIRGGNPFGDIREQGFISGLALAPNGFQGGGEGAFAQLRQLSDWVRIGLAGDLADFELINAQGQRVRADAIDYFGQRAGYTGDPAEHIKYIEAHDNETLFDVLQIKLAADTPLAERVRVQNLGHSLMLLGQGIPFFHAGQEILRSKSGDRDSYNSGDWFNAIDWTLNRSNWGRGLPPADKNEAVWPLLRPLLANLGLRPQRAHMQSTLDHVIEMTAVRMSSKLFRLRTADSVKRHLEFHNSGPEQTPGLIVLELKDEAGLTERRWRRIVGLVNARPQAVDYTLPALGGRSIALHPVLRRSSDSRVRGAAFRAIDGRFSLPARTAAVFVEPRAAAEQLVLLQADVRAGRDLGQIRSSRAAVLLDLLDVARRHLDGERGIAAQATLVTFSSLVLASAGFGDIDADLARTLVEHAGVLMQSID